MTRVEFSCLSGGELTVVFSEPPDDGESFIILCRK